MRNAKLLLVILFALTATMALGCAAAYHSYSGHCVDCKYCPPPALPYPHYTNCSCHECK